jgi:hypothetical protein
MRKAILGILAATLVSMSPLQLARATEHHHVRHLHRVNRAVVTQQFRNAHDSVVSPFVAPEYYEGYGLSAPAGRS